MRQMSQRTAVVTLVGVIVAAVASVAWAAWSVTGTASVTAKAAEVYALTAEAAPSGPLLPGLTSDITVTVENSNDFAVEVRSFSAAEQVKVDPTHAEGCSPLNVKVIPKSGLDERVEANDTHRFTVEASVQMLDNAPPACQGASFDISLALAGVTLPD
jgi:hypothetical protein